MEYDHAAAKTLVNLTLNDDLVRQAQYLTTNLSVTVERLLAGFVEQETNDAAERQRAIDRHVDASNVFVAKYGALADEFSTL